MHEHLQVLVLAHVVARVLVHGPGVARTEVHNPQYHCLLVLGDELRLTRVGLSAHTRRKHIVNRRTGTVLFYVNGLYVNGRTGIDRRTDRREITRVLPPVAANEIQRSETEVGLFLAVREVHTHETDRFPVTDRTYLLHSRTVSLERNLELVPGDISCLTVTQLYFANLLFGNMLFADVHHIRPEDHFVLVVFLVLVEGVVLVYVLDIRREGRSRTVRLGLLLGGGGVTLRTVVVFVSLQYRHFFSIVVRTSVVVEVIARGVVTRRETVVRPTVPNLRRNACLKVREVLPVSRPVLFLRGAQTVQTDVLRSSRTRFVAERYHRACRPRHVAPDSRIDASLVRSRYRQTVLKSLLAVSQNILADVTEVDVQLAVVTLRVGQCGVHQPELDILYVRTLKIRVVQPPHDTCPPFLWVRQVTVGAHLACGDVILAAIGRVVREVEDRQFGIHVACFLAVGVHLVLIDDTRTVVAQCRQVIADMRRRVRLRITEDRVHREP